MSLIESKRQEFKLRKQLLNPIISKNLLEQATPDERHKLERTLQVTTFDNMNNFNYTFDRHKELYGYRQ
jgi:hypothetical protein